MKLIALIRSFRQREAIFITGNSQDIYISYINTVNWVKGVFWGYSICSNSSLNLNTQYEQWYNSHTNPGNIVAYRYIYLYLANKDATLAKQIFLDSIEAFLDSIETELA